MILTGFSDIEIFAKSQGAYVNTKTGQYYNKLNTDAQKAKFKSGEFELKDQNLKHIIVIMNLQLISL